MKKILIFILLVSMLCMAFSACSSLYTYDENSGTWSEGEGDFAGVSNSDKGGLSLEILELDYGFCPIENEDDAVDYKNLQKLNSLEVDTQYYFVVDFSISVLNKNDGRKFFDLVLTLNDIDVLNGKIEEVGSGNISEMTFTNADTGGQGKTSTVSFRIPEQQYAVKDYRMVIKMTPITFGTSGFSVSFSSADAELKGAAVDGITKGLEIKRVTLEAPTVSFDSSTLILSWNHVKNAAYYKIFVDGEVLKDANGDDVVVRADSFVAVGHTLIYPNLSSQLSGLHTVRVQAFGDSANFLQSNYSNEVVALI